MSTQDGAWIYREAFNRGIRPDRLLHVSEWADAHRLLPQRSSAEPGQWRTSRTPYLREIMDCLSVVDPTETTVLMKGAQLGGTEAGNNWLGYVIHHSPGPMLFVQPTVDMAKRTSKQRIGPMIDECPALQMRVGPSRSRDSGNTMLVKEFPGGILIITGANSAVGLRSMPARYLFLDEVDGYPPDVEGEGDPVDLAERRTATYQRNRKIFICSTPTVKGLSRIEQAFLRSDRRYYHVPCPHCGRFQPLVWRNVVWDSEGTGEEKVHHPETARYQCEKCGKDIHESAKPKMLARGKWVPTAVGEARVRGYHLSALYSPLGWYSWTDAITDFLDAKKHGPERLKTWTNTVLGETWEEEGEQVSNDVLFLRREKYPHPVPAPVLVITAGVDVQTDRLEVEVIGWGKDEECWGLLYRTIWGDPGEKDVWKTLDDVLRLRFQHPSKNILGVACACIDSGYATQQVYEYVRARQPQPIYAVKGVAGEGRPVVSAPAKRRTGQPKQPVRVFTIGVDTAKSLLMSRLARTEHGPGYCHFPISDEYGPDYFSQLTAEKRVTRYVKGFARKEWVKIRPRNEALDCRVYGMAALYILNPLFDALAARLQKPEAGSSGGSPTPRGRPRHSWIEGWRD